MDQCGARLVQPPACPRARRFPAPRPRVTWPADLSQRALWSAAGAGKIGSAGKEMLVPAAEDTLRKWPVSKRVNSSRLPGYDPTLIEVGGIYRNKFRTPPRNKDRACEFVDRAEARGMIYFSKINWVVVCGTFASGIKRAGLPGSLVRSTACALNVNLAIALPYRIWHFLRKTRNGLRTASEALSRRVR